MQSIMGSGFPKIRLKRLNKDSRSRSGRDWVPLGVLVDSLSAWGCLSKKRERQMKDMRELVAEILEKMLDNLDQDKTNEERFKAWADAVLSFRKLKSEIEKEGGNNRD